MLKKSLIVLMVSALVTACSKDKPKPNFVYKDAPKAGVAAKIGGQEITEDELVEQDKLGFFEIKKNEYDFKMNQLKGLMVKKLVGAEAKRPT